MSQAASSSDISNLRFQPFHCVNEAAGGRVVVLCDHASNALPPAYGSLGLPVTDLERHIGWDIGAADVSRRLADALEAPAVLSGFSRLLIDPNRGADDPTLVMKLSDGAVIPGNKGVDAEEISLRRAMYWQPYQDAISRTIDRVMAAGTAPMIVSVHSFTPVWRGHPRPWHAGILWDKEPRLAHALLAGLRQERDLVIGDNEPYTGRLKGDTMYRHGTQRGLPHAIVEVRQDLIDTHAGAQEWADRLAHIVRDIVDMSPGINVVKHFGSYTDDRMPEGSK
ncbi:MAG: N-formylglutamate amidohydrolase [Candidatus Phaeomarinobacter sp.]